MHTSHISKKGFTLVELMVSIAIIALLTGIVVTSLTPSKAKARDSKRISDLGQLQLALSLYFDRCKVYPDVIPLNLTVNSGYGGGTCAVNFGNFIATLPNPPAPTTQYDYAILEDGSTSDVSDYVLHVKLESYNEVIKDGLSTYPPYTAPSGKTWLKASGVTITCSNAVNTTDYCLGSK